MQIKKLNIGWLLVIIVSIIPIILWFLTPKIDLPFNNIQNGLASFGELFGLVGMVLFSINFILATRITIIERLFNGLNNVYKKHDFIGQLALILLLFHPLLLLPKYVSSFKEAINFLFISNLWARNYGIIALWTMIVLIIFTLYLKPKYNIWKITHKFFGFALFLGGLHAYLIPGYVMNNILLKSYILGFAILGVLAFIYKSIFGKYLIKNHQYIVENINHLNKNIIEITLKPKNKKLNFHAGQFIFISFQKKSLLETHPFSISSAPDEELLKITVKTLGDYTTRLKNKLTKNTVAKIEGPYGVFSYDKINNKNQVWIAGGIGITPFISFIKDITKKNIQNINITLFYCVKDNDETVGLDFFRNSKTKINNFSVIPFYSSEYGHLNINHIKENLKYFIQNDFLICAPQKMIRTLKNNLIKEGINKNNIHSEEFNF